MSQAAASRAPAWQAQLALEFAKRGRRTVLARRAHDGPLVVQKPLYPEGDAVCHTIIVHPPGGIAGGDRLDLGATVQPGSSVLLTTPGATKWYRSAGPTATQNIQFTLGPDTTLEWLPQETIVFDAALAEQKTEVRLGAESCYIGWEILCLGRSGAGERFTNGKWLARTLIDRGGKPLLLERACLEGGGAGLRSPALLADQPVVGTLIAAAPQLSVALLGLCRQAAPVGGDGAVTLLPGVLVARYLGDSSEAAKKYFFELWRILRPALLRREGIEPRIWRT
ncbi:MAG: urease accessory protein [Deltaproteobacteria bacterium]|nr:urease accessory protein [Deltaproteobacteria bacterium]